MADKYCTLPEGGSGAFTGAIWSNTPGGPATGGVPVAADTIHFATSCTVTGYRTTVAGSLVVPAGIVVTLVTAAESRVAWTAANNSLLDIDGTLVFTGGGEITLNRCRIKMGAGAVLESRNQEMIRLGNADDAGTPIPNINYDFHPTATIRNVVGKIDVVTSSHAGFVLPPANYEVPVTTNIGFYSDLQTGIGVVRLLSGTYRLTRLNITQNAEAQVGWEFDLGGATIHTGDVRLTVDRLGLVIRNDGANIVTQGSITGNITSEVYSESPLNVTLIGTQDQVIDLFGAEPLKITLVLDKQAGCLTIQEFRCFMTGHAPKVELLGGDVIGLKGTGRIGEFRLTGRKPSTWQRLDSMFTFGTLIIEANDVYFIYHQVSDPLTVVEGDLSITSTERGEVIGLWQNPINGYWGGTEVWSLRGGRSGESSGQHVFVHSAFDNRFRFGINTRSPEDPEGAGKTVFLDRYVGDLTACHAGKLVVGEQSQINLCYYYPPEGPETFQSFDGYADEVENHGDIRFISYHEATRNNTALPEIHPVLRADRFINIGTASAEQRGSTEPQPFCGRLAQLSSNAVFENSGTFSERIERFLTIDEKPTLAHVAAWQTGAYKEVKLTFEATLAESVQVDWGDGSEPETRSSVLTETSGFQWTHLYDRIGHDYTITITARNEMGVMTVEKTVRISLALQLQLTVNPSSGTAPLSVVAHTENSVADEFMIDWGDGTTTELLTEVGNVGHTYMTGGAFQVILSGRFIGDTDFQTCSQLVVVETEIPEEVIAVLNVEPSSGTAPLSIGASASGSQGSFFRFDWGDGTGSGWITEKHQTHTYERPGDYIVSLLVQGGMLTAAASRSVKVQTPVSGQTILPVLIRPAETIRPRGRERLSASLFRTTLAQGESFMIDTIELFCRMDECGRALDNGSSLFLARLQHADGTPVLPAEVREVGYSLWRLDDADASIKTPISGHIDVPLDVEEVMLDHLTTDEHWSFDTVGYNFRHWPDGSAEPLFPVAGRNYRMEYRLKMVAAVPDVLLRYRIHVV